MNRYLLLKLTAAAFAAAVLTGCSLLKVAVSTGDPLSKQDANLRTMTRGFYYDFSSEVARTADSIVSASTDPQVQIAAIRWKLRATRAAVSAAMQAVPEVALADTWILCRRMNEALTAAPDSLLFGAQSDLARQTAVRLDRRVVWLAKANLTSTRYELMGQFVEAYLRNNPTTKGGVESANTTLAWIEFLREHGIENTPPVGSIAEVLADVNDRMSSQTQQISNSIGWSKDMLDIRMQQDSLRSQLGAQLDSLERNFNRMVVVAEHLPQISDHVIGELKGQMTQLIWTMNAAVDNAFANLGTQRDALQQYLSQERVELVDQAQKAVDDALKTALDRIPALIGKVLFYLVLALVVLLGLPFAGGFWLGRWRERSKGKTDTK